MVISKKIIIFQGFRGGPTFSRGCPNIFKGGVQMLISIETHITCDFPGGGGGRTPYPPSGSAHAKHMLNLIGKKIFKILRSIIVFIIPPVRSI